MSRKILIVTGDAGETYETLYAQHRFQEAGYQPVIAAPSKRRLHLVIHDFEPGWDTYVERPGYLVESDITFDEVRADEYVAVLFIGGRAPEYLRNDPRVLRIARDFRDQGSWVLAICHGIQILVSAGFAPGADLTCYEHCRYEVEAAGGRWIDRQAVRDGKVITGQTWQSHPEFYREVMAALGEGVLVAATVAAD